MDSNAVTGSEKLRRKRAFDYPFDLNPWRGKWD